MASRYSLIPQVTVPEGVSGIWKVERFTVSTEDSKMDSLYGSFHGNRFTPPGTYTRLTRNGFLIMSDTPDEMRDHLSPVHYAQGHILINGLGLGMVLNACLVKPEVEKATVIEMSEDVINLVGPHYKQLFGDRVEIIHASAFDYKPPKEVRYGMVWHDIWGDLCSDNLEEMARLHRKYARKTEWQGSWGKEICLDQRKREKRDRWY